MLNTIPFNPFPPSTEHAGSGGSGDSGKVTVNIFDKYALSIDTYGALVVTKTHMGETTTQTIPHSGSHTIDDRFTVNDVNGWNLTLLSDSTEYPAGTNWNWRYGFAPPISELTFVSESKTDTIENLLTELYNK